MQILSMEHTEVGLVGKILMLILNFTQSEPEQKTQV